MSRIQVFTDSTCDLSETMLQEYDIEVVPLHVVFDDRDYKDGVELNSERLFRFVEERGSLPKTAAPSPGEFAAAFEPYIDQGCNIVYIGLSSKLSTTYQNACLAAGLFPEGRIVCVDSLNVASGVGVLAIKAVQAAAAGQSPEEIEVMLLKARERVQTEIAIDTLDYLYKGGRCSALQSFIGGLLKIRPVLKVVEGSIIPSGKIRGKRERALEQLLQNLLDKREKIADDFLFVEHAMAEEEAAELKACLEQTLGFSNIHLAEAGCVISSHCGPRTVGFIYLTKDA